MANIYTLKSGVASDTTVWSGGVVPVSGDRVLICTGHTVTVDGTYTWGDDSTSTVTINSVSTTASIFVNGTLKASRTANSQLTCRGECQMATGGTLDYGTEADPIPAAYTAVILVNDSASQAHGKYGLSTSTTLAYAGFRMWGAAKTPRTTMSAALSTDTTVTVADATGWAIGDVLVFGISVAEGGVNSHRYRAITGVTGNSITIGANLSYASQEGRTVMNLTRNVRVRGVNGNTYRSFVSLYAYTNVVANSWELGHCEINLTGGVTNQWQISGLNLYYSSTTNPTVAPKKIYRPVVHSVWAVSGSTVTSVSNVTQTLVNVFGNQSANYTIEELTCSQSYASSAVSLYAGASVRVKNSHFLRAGYAFTCGYSQGPVGCVIDEGWFEALSNSPLVGQSGISVAVQNSTINGIDRIANTQPFAFGELTYTGCNYGGSQGVYNPTTAIVGATGAYFKCTYSDCTFPAFSTTRTTGNLSVIHASSYHFFRNINNDTTQQLIYRKGGRVIRDNSTVNRGQSSLAMYSWYSTAAITHQSTVSVGANSTVKIQGYARFNAAFGTANPPTLTVSGLGITPVVYTAPATADAWHLIDLDITNPQSYPGTLTLDFSALSAANTETAAAWFDGIAMADFVPWTRHYGYTYDPSNPLRTADPVVQLTEAQAVALTGISYAAGTLTVSSAHTIREVYDWMQWYECSNRLAPIMTSSDGISFALSADFDLSAALTGTGSLSMPSNTLTFAGSTTLNITHDAGVMTTIAVTGLVSGSRIQLVDMSGPTELYNDVPGTSLTINSNWTTDKTIRLRVAYAVGAVAKLPIETSGILSSTGASFLVSQIADPVYNALAIDGSTCTEFAPDYPNLQIDVSDGDGTTSVQRLYAWSAWAQTSEQGIDLMFQAVQATDTSNFVIDVDVVDAKLDNVTGSPVIVAGGYLARSDGTTVIASTSGSIHMDPGKAYLTAGAPDSVAVAVLAAAQATPIYADARKMNGAAVQGVGSESDKWRGLGV